MQNPLSGKVTLDGKGVTGNLVFVGADNKESPPLLLPPDGSYLIDLAPGDYTILIKGQGALAGGIAPGGLQAPPGGFKGPEMSGVNPAGGAAGGAAPPAKYGSVETSDLKFKKSAGKETHNIELKAS